MPKYISTTTQILKIMHQLSSMTKYDKRYRLSKWNSLYMRSARAHIKRAVFNQLEDL